MAVLHDRGQHDLHLPSQYAGCAARLSRMGISDGTGYFHRRCGIPAVLNFRRRSEALIGGQRSNTGGDPGVPVFQKPASREVAGVATILGFATRLQ